YLRSAPPQRNIKRQNRKIIHAPKALIPFPPDGFHRPANFAPGQRVFFHFQQEDKWREHTTH
ncbi:MAG TPA: hypothetical protein QF533_03850, partial [Nitrospinota bacterium]|nr:hypothetical protein [Nitrospinota bacterium]